MGLREKKALKVRDAIHQATLTLSEANGYEATTLDQVADRAEVAVSTVYRYFENKDAILLAPLERDSGALAEVFRGRPVDEEISISLGWTILAGVDIGAEELRSLRRVRALLDHAPGPRARLWDLIEKQRSLLEEAIAERSANGPLWDGAAAHLTVMIIGMAHDHNRSTLDPADPVDYANQIIAMLRGTDAPLPVSIQQAER
jgi:AcrR family transcriptional regulator